MRWLLVIVYAVLVVAALWLRVLWCCDAGHVAVVVLCVLAQSLMTGLADNRVMVVCGDTGCGKSTQVPQMLLADPVLGKNARIVVTQV